MRTRFDDPAGGGRLRFLKQTDFVAATTFHLVSVVLLLVLPVVSAILSGPLVLIRFVWHLLLALTVESLLDSQSSVGSQVAVRRHRATSNGHVSSSRVLLSVEVLSAEVAILLHDLGATLSSPLTINPLRQYLLAMIHLVLHLLPERATAWTLRCNSNPNLIILQINASDIMVNILDGCALVILLRHHSVLLLGLAT